MYLFRLQNNCPKVLYNALYTLFLILSNGRPAFFCILQVFQLLSSPKLQNSQ